MFSMTGFGMAESSNQDYRVKIQVKSVNHKFLDLKIKGLNEDFNLENTIKDYLGKRINRGHVDVFVDLEKNYEDSLAINEEMFNFYRNILLEAKDKLEDTSPIRAEWILGQSKVISREEKEANEEELYNLVMGVLEKACDSLDQMRLAEGSHLYDDMKDKLSELSLIHESILSKASLTNEEIGRKLRERILEIQEDISLDEARLATEVALLLDKISIDEEITRLSSHIEQFNVIMESKEPIGRRLDFLLQEMHREANTMGSKSRDVEVLHKIVGLKVLIENLREQVQNIE